jgi:hypothetical protein
MDNETEPGWSFWLGFLVGVLFSLLFVVTT